MPCKTIGVVFALVLLVSGCAIPGTETAPGVTVLFVGDMERTDGNFSMEGDLSLSAAFPDRESYRNVTLSLCTKDGRVFETRQLGTLPTDEDLPVSVSTDRVPYYVVFESRDFWTENEFIVHSYKWYPEDEVYGIVVVGSRSDLPCRE